VAPNYVSSDELLGSWSQNGSIARGNFQVAMFSYVGSPEPQDYKYNLQSRYCDRTAKVHSTLNGNGSCVRNTSIDRSFAAAARTFNAGARASDYATVERAVNQRAYWVPLYFRKPSVPITGGWLTFPIARPSPALPGTFMPGKSGHDDGRVSSALDHLQHSRHVLPAKGLREDQGLQDHLIHRPAVAR
jgi:hypothetical protein